MTIQADPDTAAVPPLEHPLEEGWTLPASWYSDETVASRASASASSRGRGSTPALPSTSPSRARSRPRRPGTSRSSSTRDREGALRAFVNVCRHRAYVIAQGNGCRETLQCAYHAWTYELDGSPAPRATLGARGGVRPGRLLAAPGLRRHLGPVPLRQPGRRRRAAGRDARRPAGDRRRERARPRRRFASTRTTSGRSRRTGRSRSRTTSSATTARRRTRASAR